MFQIPERRNLTRLLKETVHEFHLDVANTRPIGQVGQISIIYQRPVRKSAINQRQDNRHVEPPMTRAGR
jgi:hypothetical protein